MQTDYDVLGRVYRTSVPTETNSSWAAAGDDASRGWIWNYTHYDWKGRTVRTVPSDSTGTDGKDTLITYAGCGCAGGLVTTVSGPVTTAVDVSGTTQTTKRRTQKVYDDILGRTYKAEIWDLDGGGTAPYSTTKTTFNGRDQATLIRQYAGADTSSTYQDTTMSYDGHARLYQSHKPEQRDSSNNPTYTTYSYNPDDSIATVTDARGAVTTKTYNSRGLLTGVAYSVPGGSGIVDPSDIGYSYDNLGNRTQMTDGLGQVDYTYDSLSRLTKERRDFTDTLADAPISGSKYDLDYTYTLSGGLASITDPFGAVVSYTPDKLGRTTAVGGSGFYDDFAGRTITSYVSSIHYRAFGGLKDMTYATDDATSIDMSYDNALRPTSYEAVSSANTSAIQDKTYTYNNDGTVKEAINAVESNYSRYFDYDFAARLKRDEFGTGSPGSTKPYKETLGYDAFNNITSRNTNTWDWSAKNFAATYTNHRKTSGGFNGSTDTYDNNGNITQNSTTSSDVRTWSFDAANNTAQWQETAPYIGSLLDTGAIITYDGDGKPVKRLKRNRNRHNGNTTWVEEPEFNIFSSVTGQRITTTTLTGQKLHTYVYLNGAVIADQNYGTNNNSQLYFRHSDPVTGSEIQSQVSGELHPGGIGRVDSTALGAVIPQSADPETFTFDPTKGGHTFNPEAGCSIKIYIDGMPALCNDPMVTMLLRDYSIGGHIVVPKWRETQDPGFYRFAGWEAFRLSSGNEADERPSRQRIAKFDEQKFKDCVKLLFDTEVDSYEIGKKFNGRSRDAVDWFTDIFIEPFIGFFGVDVSAFEVNTKSIHSRELQYKVGGLLGTGGHVVWGWTYKSDPNNNFTVSDIGNNEFQQAIWVYELGNALGYITGNKPTVEDPRRYENVSVNNPDDVGGALMDCVFGGAVDPMGRVKPPVSRASIFQ